MLRSPTSQAGGDDVDDRFRTRAQFVLRQNSKSVPASEPSEKGTIVMFHAFSKIEVRSNVKWDSTNLCNSEQIGAAI